MGPDLAKILLITSKWMGLDLAKILLIISKWMGPDLAKRDLATTFCHVASLDAYIARAESNRNAHCAKNMHFTSHC